MAEEPGFFSSEGFPYPLLALGQTFPRGYQYQSERTPYRRDAKGDWGRALNESMDQFFCNVASVHAAEKTICFAEGSA